MDDEFVTKEDFCDPSNKSYVWENITWQPRYGKEYYLAKISFVLSQSIWSVYQLISSIDMKFTCELAYDFLQTK